MKRVCTICTKQCTCTSPWYHSQVGISDLYSKALRTPTISPSINLKHKLDTNLNWKVLYELTFASIIETLFSMRVILAARLPTCDWILSTVCSNPDDVVCCNFSVFTSSSCVLRSHTKFANVWTVCNHKQTLTKTKVCAAIMIITVWFRNNILLLAQ